MASPIPQTKARPALIVLDERMMGATITASSEQGPHPGVPEPVRPTAAALEASGALEDPVEEVTVTAQKAGGVGRGTFTFRGDGTGDGIWSTAEHHHDPPLLVTDAEFIHRSTTAGAWRSPCVRRRANGRGLASVTASTTIAKVLVEDPDGGNWSTSTAEDTGAATVTAVLVRQDDLRVYYTIDSSYVGSETQVRMRYSLDDGASWTTGSTDALVTAIPYASSMVKRIRVAECRGQVILLVWVKDGNDYLYQYVSADGGATFDLVSMVSNEGVAAPDVVAWCDSLYVATIRYDATDSTLRPYLQILPSAGTMLMSMIPLVAVPLADTVEWAIRTGSGLTSVECAIVVDDDGRIWIYGTNYNGDQETIATVSSDGGATWETPRLAVVDTYDAATYPKDLTACAGSGSVLMLCTYTGAPSTADDSLFAMYLGGWTTIGMPETTGMSQPTAAGGWARLYLPFDYPTDVGYTEAATGSAVLGAGGVSVTNTGSQFVTWSWTPPSPSPGREFWGAMITVVANTATLTGSTLRLDLVWSNGTKDYAARAEFSPSGSGTATLSIDDLNGSGLVTEAADHHSGVVELRLCIRPGTGFTADDGVATAYVREVQLGGPRTWTTVQLTGLNDGSATASLCRVSARDDNMTVKWWAFTSGDEMAYIDPAQHPTRGRLWCPTTSPAYLFSGLSVGMVAAPAQSGDAWTIATTYDYPVTSIDPSRSPSPSRVWRAEDDDQADIVIRSSIGWRAGDLVAFVLKGANWRRAAIYADDTATTKIADVDMAGGNAGLPFARTRNMLHPAEEPGASVMSFHAMEGELTGATVAFGSPRVERRIKHNWSGVWRKEDPDSYRSARVVFEGSEAGAAVGGEDLEIWFPDALIITTIMESTDTIMLRIDGETTVEGALQLGTFAIGRVVLLAHPYDANRVRGRATGTEITTLPGGARSSRVMHRPRRMVDVSWDDGVVTAYLNNAQAGALLMRTSPDWIATGSFAGAVPAGTLPETAYLVDGVFAQVSGGHRPVIYLASLPEIEDEPTATAPVTIVQPSRWLYGRITTEEMRLDTVHGDEHSDAKPEVVRVATIRIEEEL